MSQSGSGIWRHAARGDEQFGRRALLAREMRELADPPVYLLSGRYRPGQFRNRRPLPADRIFGRDRREDFLLVAEMGVERRALDAGRLGDLLHRRRSKTP